MRASERSGSLPEALGRFVTYQTQLDGVKKHLVSASIYPVILVVVGGLVTLFLLGYVVPRFSHIYADIGGDLPWLSRMLLVWGGFVDLRKPFQFVPFDYYRNVRFDRRGNPIDRAIFTGKDRLTDYGRANVVGIQGNLWSEALGGDGRLDYKLVPKLLGLAERAWAPEPDWAREKDEARAEALFREAWSVFASVHGRRELPRLDREAGPWRYRIPKPGLRVVDGQAHASLELKCLKLKNSSRRKMKDGARRRVMKSSA